MKWLTHLMAMPETFCSLKTSKAHHIAEEKKAATEASNKINGKEIVIKAKAGANGKLFGAVTSKEIAGEIKAKFGLEVDKKKISVSDIKSYGEYTAEVKFYNGIVANLSIKVTE